MIRENSNFKTTCFQQAGGSPAVEASEAAAVVSTVAAADSNTTTTREAYINDAIIRARSDPSLQELRYLWQRSLQVTDRIMSEQRQPLWVAEEEEESDSEFTPPPPTRAQARVSTLQQDELEMRQDASQQPALRAARSHLFQARANTRYNTAIALYNELSNEVANGNVNVVPQGEISDQEANPQSNVRYLPDSATSNSSSSRRTSRSTWSGLSSIDLVELAAAAQETTPAPTPTPSPPQQQEATEDWCQTVLQELRLLRQQVGYINTQNYRVIEEIQHDLQRRGRLLLNASIFILVIIVAVVTVQTILQMTVGQTPLLLPKNDCGFVNETISETLNHLAHLVKKFQDEYEFMFPRRRRSRSN